MSDYRALTLLHTEYKIYERILVQRLSTIFGDINHPSQYCCPWKDTIMDIAAGTWKIVTYAEQTQCAICILPLDFWTVFERYHTTICATILLNMVLTIPRLKYCGPHTKMLPPEAM